MSEFEDKAPEIAETEEVEVVAHSSDEEEDEPWCVVNNSSDLA